MLVNDWSKLQRTTNELWAIRIRTEFSELKKLANMQSIQMKNIFALTERICADLSRNAEYKIESESLFLYFSLFGSVAIEIHI